MPCLFTQAGMCLYGVVAPRASECYQESCWAAELAGLAAQCCGVVAAHTGWAYKCRVHQKKHASARRPCRHLPTLLWMLRCAGCHCPDLIYLFQQADQPHFTRFMFTDLKNLFYDLNNQQNNKTWNLKKQITKKFDFMLVSF